MVNDKLLYVNVAAGRFPEEGFINLDNSVFFRLMPLYKRFKFFFPKKYHSIFDDVWVPNTKQNKYIRHNCLKPLPFRENSINHILSSHFIEHVYPSEVEVILKDFYNKLVIGGSLHIIVPDLNFLAKQYLESKNENAASDFMAEVLQKTFDKPSLLYRILEFTGNFGLDHRWMYDVKTLEKMILKANFKITKNISDLPSQKHYEYYKKHEGNLQIFATKY